MAGVAAVRRNSGHIELPSWIFDVDEDDEIDPDTPLLVELDIDIAHIYRNIKWMIFGPWSYFCCRRYDRHPLQNLNKSNNIHIDFWGLV